MSGRGRGSGKDLSKMTESDLDAMYSNPLSRGAPGDIHSYRPERNRDEREERGGRRSSPYDRPRDTREYRRDDRDDGDWRHDKVQQGGGGGGRKVISTKRGGGSGNTRGIITVSNLDGEVTATDLEEIFAEVGDLKSCVINLTDSGKSKGTAEIQFASPADATSAIAEYDGAEVDGRPMYVVIKEAPPSFASKVVKRSGAPAVRRDSRDVRRPMDDERSTNKSSLFGSNLGHPDFEDDYVDDRVDVRGAYREPRERRGGGGGGGGGFRRAGGGGARRGGPRGGGRGGGRGGRGGGRGGDKPSVSAADLDAEMDAYHSKKADE